MSWHHIGVLGESSRQTMQQGTVGIAVQRVRHLG